MVETKKEKLDQVLTKFMQVGQVKAVGIVSVEGLLITSRMPPDMNERIVGALCSTIIASAETASSQMGTGAVSEVHVKTEHGILLLKPAGQKALLFALAEVEAQFGLITLEIEIRGKQVQDILEEV
ncbi:MAG: roadblock/LC7 domain-containing protein [ANME-2 cluster archaeon]|jgi:predicted regulator of Ras-like GTPase activity (Roadblock/LC7/MglB family)|nr:roadblock/LC7 domain-containing protein [ANME-2 cluster archaeon]